MRTVLVGLGLVVALAACGDSGSSMSEYGDRLNAMASAYGSEAEAAWVEFLALDAPTLADLRILFEHDVASRIGVEESYGMLDPPAEIADLHNLLGDWLARLTDADEALLTRIGTVASWDEFLGSVEYRTFEETLLGGAEVCVEFQAELDATAAQGVFADTPWIPGELEDVADVVIGCNAIPDDLDAAFSQ